MSVQCLTQWLQYIFKIVILALFIDYFFDMNILFNNFNALWRNISPYIKFSVQINIKWIRTIVNIYPTHDKTN